MSFPQPTGERATVALELPAPQAKILRGTLSSCLEGANEDLRPPGCLPDPSRVRREVAAYRRLLSALDAGEIALQAMRATGVGRTATYRRAAALIEAGLLERLDLLRSFPSLLHATRDGLRYAGLAMPVAKVSPGAVDHWLRCATVALDLGERYGHDRVLTEREILATEALEERPLGKIPVGLILAHGNQRVHRPDLIVSTDEGRVAIKVELTPKAPRRLEELLRGWRSAVVRGEVIHARSLCEPGQTRRLVERIVRKTHTERYIRIGEAPERGRERRG
jgi:hypothetical protein